MSIFKRMMLVFCVAAMGLLAQPQHLTSAARADDNDGRYWNRYWNWYNGSYRPYYNNWRGGYGYGSRGYGYGYYPGYSTYYGGPYGYGYGGYGYGSPYYGGYRGNFVQIGPLGIGWR